LEDQDMTDVGGKIAVMGLFLLVLNQQKFYAERRILRDNRFQGTRHSGEILDPGSD
jgi:hypothetical protein